ncbi:hypothetical protein MTO96_035438 [Rhipicephalus appendiculatus]
MTANVSLGHYSQPASIQQRLGTRPSAKAGSSLRILRPARGQEPPGQRKEGPEYEDEYRAHHSRETAGSEDWAAGGKENEATDCHSSPGRATRSPPSSARSGPHISRGQRRRLRRKKVATGRNKQSQNKGTEGRVS